MENKGKGIKLVRELLKEVEDEMATKNKGSDPCATFKSLRIIDQFIGERGAALTAAAIEKADEDDRLDIVADACTAVSEVFCDHDLSMAEGLIIVVTLYFEILEYGVDETCKKKGE